MKEYPKNTAYLVSVNGEVFSKNYNHTGKTKKLRTFTNNKGYVWVPLYDKMAKKDKSVYVHRIVAETFLDNLENKKEINHKDGNPQNNNVTNLEWVTRSENEQHKYRVLGRKQAKNKKVICSDTNEVFESIHEAGRAKKILPQNIWKVIKGYRKTCGGLHWRKYVV